MFTPGVEKMLLDRFFRNIKMMLLAVGILLCVPGCGDSSNMPYEPDTPAPEEHSGKFISDHGSMTFDGDGSSVVIDFDDELAGKLGLPSGEHEGSYAFLSGDLPPGGSTEVRYDVAHELKLMVGDESAVVAVGLASEDGKTASVGTGIVTADRIPLLIFEDGVNTNVIFIKE